MMKKLQKYVLTVGVSAATMLSLNSCKNSEKEAAEQERAMLEQIDAEKRLYDQRRETSIQIGKHARDSVLNAMGYDDSVVSSLVHSEGELMTLDNLSQKDVLRARVDTLIAINSRKCAVEIMNLFKKYDLHIADPDWYIEKRSENEILTDFARSEYFNYATNRTYAKRFDDETERAKIMQPTPPYGMFVDFNWRDYDKEHQAEVQNAVLKIFDNMNNNLDKAIRGEVKKFAKYYPILDLRKSGVPAAYAKLYKDFDPIDCYEEYRFAFENVDKEMHVTRSVSVYDSRLNTEFFGVPDAKYKLVKVSEGRWQVVRTSKDGKVDKTLVFGHNVDYKYEIDQGGAELIFTPGANVGVHVHAREEMWTKKAKKSDKYPDPYGKIAAKRDSLMADVARLRELDKRMDEILATADSIAKIKQQEYMNKTR